MPVPDPLPNARESTKRRFLRIFRLLIPLSLVVAAIAVALVSQGDPTLHLNMLIATALGVCFTVLVGTSLMTLTFLSAQSGHDDEAATLHHKEDE